VTTCARRFSSTDRSGTVGTVRTDSRNRDTAQPRSASCEDAQLASRLRAGNSDKSQQQLRLLLNLPLPIRDLRDVRVWKHRKPSPVNRVTARLQRQFIAPLAVHAPPVNP